MEKKQNCSSSGLIIFRAKSQVQALSSIGDSNLPRHVNKNSCCANQSLKAAQMLPCNHAEIYVSSLERLPSKSNVCTVACITSFLTNAEGPLSILHHVDPVLQDFCSSDRCLRFPSWPIHHGLTSHVSDRSRLISEGLTEIMNLPIITRELKWPADAICHWIKINPEEVWVLFHWQQGWVAICSSLHLLQEHGQPNHA